GWRFLGNWRNLYKTLASKLCIADHMVSIDINNACGFDFCSVNISNAGAGLATCCSKSSNYVRGVGFYSFALNATADDHISGALSGQSGGFDDVRSFGGNRQRIATRTGGKDELGAVGGRCGDYHCGSF
ncbi:MAG: hypothetical protein ACPHI0_07275, partial [Paracoccaceae bacterium]